MKIPNNVKIKRAIRAALKPGINTMERIYSGQTRFYKILDKGKYGIPGAVIERAMQKRLAKKYEE